jgi:hypothetical protein
MVGIGLLVALGLAIAVSTVLFLNLTNTKPRVEIPPPGVAISAHPPIPRPPAPRLETQPGQTLAPLRASENEVLNSYAWVDQSKGIVRLPIDLAMDLIAAQGLPVQAAASGQPYRDQGRFIPSASSSGRSTEELVH